MPLVAEAPGSAGTLKPQYLEAVSRVERLHRRLLDLIKDEFDRMGWDDINPVQALLMFNIGDAEMTAGELRSRGYYLGSQRLLQSQEAGRDRLHLPGALARRSPVGPHSTDAQGRGSGRGHRRALRPSSEVDRQGRRSRSRARSRASTRPSAASSASGSTKFCTSSKPKTSKVCGASATGQSKRRSQGRRFLFVPQNSGLTISRRTSLHSPVSLSCVTDPDSGLHRSLTGVVVEWARMYSGSLTN